MIREGRDFAFVGVAQWFVDAAVMIAASHFDVSIGIANLAGRIAGASLGFWVNGAVTFAGTGGERDDRWNIVRYAIVWIAACWLSTLGVMLLDRALGRHAAWFGKPIIDGLLGLASFVASRHWVYR